LIDYAKRVLLFLYTDLEKGSSLSFPYFAFVHFLMIIYLQLSSDAKFVDDSFYIDYFVLL